MGFLLTEFSNTEIIVRNVLLVVLIIAMGLWLYKRYKNTPDGDEKLQEFFKSMENIIIDNIIETLQKVDVKNFDLAELQVDFFDNIVDDIWKLLDNEIEKLIDTDNVLYRVLRKAITIEKVKEYVATVYASETIQDKIIEIYNIAIDGKNKEIEEEEARLAEEMLAYEEDRIDADPVEELDPMVDINAPVEDQVIIPPVEEESDTVLADDPTIEIIDDANINDSVDVLEESTVADTESLDEN